MFEGLKFVKKYSEKNLGFRKAVNEMIISLRSAMIDENQINEENELSLRKAAQITKFIESLDPKTN